MLPTTKMPALPDPFPSHSPSWGLHLTCLRAYLGPKEIILWIFGGACPETIDCQLKRWKSELLKEFDFCKVFKNLAQSPHERHALVYLFEVLLLDNLKDAVLDDGQEDAATSLCVGTVSTSHPISAKATDPVEAHTQTRTL